MTQRENIKKAIEHLQDAVDIFPDKDDEIREYNRILYEILDKLEALLK